MHWLSQRVPPGTAVYPSLHLQFYPNHHLPDQSLCQVSLLMFPLGGHIPTPTSTPIMGRLPGRVALLLPTALQIVTYFNILFQLTRGHQNEPQVTTRKGTLVSQVPIYHRGYLIAKHLHTLIWLGPTRAGIHQKDFPHPPCLTVLRSPQANLDFQGQLGHQGHQFNLNQTNIVIVARDQNHPPLHGDMMHPEDKVTTFDREMNPKYGAIIVFV